MGNTIKTLLVVFVSVCVTIIAMLLLWTSVSNKPLLPDKPPDAIDENASIDDFDKDKLETPDGGSGLSLEYTKEISIDLKTQTATLYFKNAGESLQNAAVFLIVQDTIVSQSGLLPPGAAITTMPLSEKGALLQNGNYTGAFIVQFFNENGEESQLNSRIEGISITVK